MLKNTGAFAGKTIFVTGGSRGIGKAIALKLAKDGCNVVIAAKTTQPHPKLEGTIYTAAKEIESAGGKCLPVQCDLREEEAVQNAINQAVDKFGHIDILINNASAISLTGTEETTMKKYDLMNQINARGTFLASKLCIPHLRKSSNPHILNLSPPLVMDPVWFSRHLAYTMAKYGMSMCVLGMSDEFKEDGIAVNALWPRTAIWTAAMAMLGGGQMETARMCRKPEIMSDSAYAILSKNSRECTGNFFIDEDVIKNEGITDLDQYAIEPGAQLLADFFLPEKYIKGLINNLGVDPEDSPSPSSSSSASGGDQVMEILNKARSKLTDDVKKEINATLLFVVSGQNYLLDANASRPLKIEKLADDDESIEKSDMTMIVDQVTFVKLAKGVVKPTNAFMAGHFKIKGDVSLALKAEKIFKSFRD